MNRNNTDVAFVAVLALETSFILFVAHNNDFINIVEALAMLVSGIGFPLYVGIIRGAALDELDLERILGWMILIAGNSVNLALVLILVQFPFAVFIGAFVLIVGVGIAWWFGGKLCGVYRIDRDHERRVILAGGCMASVLFSITCFGTATLLALINTAANSIGLVAAYWVIAWVVLVYVYYVAGAQRTWSAMLNRQDTLRELERRGRFADFVRRAQGQKNPLFDAIEFAYAAVNTLRRERSVYFLAILSFIVVGYASHSLEPPIDWSLIYWLGVAADAMLLVSMIVYLRIPKERLLESASR